MSTYYEVTIRTDNPILLPAYVDTDGNFCFGKLIPMPDDLNIKSGTVIDDAIAYYVTERLTKPVEGTNLGSYITNTLWPGDWAEEVVLRLEDAVDSGRKYDPEHLEELYRLGEQYVFNIDRYKYPTWYEWRCANWGCKWDALECKFDCTNPCEVSFCVTSVPFGIFERLCNMFSESEIHFSVFRVGEWENEHGKLVETECTDEETYCREDTDFEDDTFWYDDPFEEQALVCLEKADQKIHTYTIRDGFWVDIIEQQNVWECYLYHETCGVKSRVMTLPKEGYMLSDVERIFAINMNEQMYLLEYRMEFMR